MNHILRDLTDVSAFVAARAQQHERFPDPWAAREALDALADQVEILIQRVPDYLDCSRSLVEDAHRLLIEARVEVDGDRQAEMVPALLRVADSRLLKAFHTLAAVQRATDASMAQVLAAGRVGAA